MKDIYESCDNIIIRLYKSQSWKQFREHSVQIGERIEGETIGLAELQGQPYIIVKVMNKDFATLPQLYFKKIEK